MKAKRKPFVFKTGRVPESVFNAVKPRTILKNYIFHQGCTIGQFAEFIGVCGSTMSNLFTGAVDISEYYAKKIEVATQGELSVAILVPLDDEDNETTEEI